VSETSANETDNSSTTNPDNKPNYTGIRTITSLCKMAPPLTNILLDAHRYFAMDIGGSLCKITFFEPSPDKVPAEQAAKLKQMIAYMNSSVCYGTTGKRDDELSFPFEGGRWHFMHFETRRMEGALKLLKENGMHAMPSLTLPATGGGAYKFSSLFQSQLGVTLEKRDEMKCLLTGLNFLLQHYEKECWYLKDPSRPLVSDKIYVPMRQEAGSQIFPYLLVNCGSGVSIIRVDSEDRFERVGGSCIGGGTYWGLARLLLRCTTFEQAMEMCMNGDFAKVDMLVGDIYGSHGYPSLGLHARTVACAFGKMVMAHDPAVVQGASNADVAASLLHMIGANIAQVAYLTAVKENTTRVIFAGNFLRQNLISSGFLSYSIDYWSGGKLRALFLEHEGYFGSLGALFSPE
jgi:type II pantothenate kinase